MLSSSDEVSSGYDSDLEKDALEASKKILESLKRGKKKIHGKDRPKKSQTCQRKVVKKTSEIVVEEKSESTLSFFVDKTPLRLENEEEGNKKSIYDEDFFEDSSEHVDKDSRQQKDAGKNMPTKPLKKKMGSLSSSLQTGMQITDNYLNNKSKKKNRDNFDELMKKSVLTPDFEKQFALTPYEESIRQQKKQRRKEKEKTKGRNWYNMVAPEMTEEKKNDLAVIQMRKALDPKRFYKNNDSVALPKYFQLGTVVESSADFFHSRIPKKQRKSNMVEELLADAEFRKYNKRKYVEIQEQKRKAQGPYKHMKRMKKNKR